MIEIFLLVVALLGAAATSYTDLRSRLIPNAITLPLTLFGLLANLALGIYYGDFSSFYGSLIGVASIFVVGYVLWFLGVLPAGDVKELMFIAALVPAYPRTLLTFFAPVISPSYPFIFSILFDTILAVSPWVMGYSIYLARRKGVLSRLFAPFGELNEVLESAFVISAVLLFSEYLELHSVFGLLVLVLVFSMERKRRLPLAGVLVLAYAAAGISGEDIGVLEALGGTFLTIFTALFLLKFLLGSLRFLGGGVLQDEKRIGELEEGDILAERICEKGGKVFRDARGTRERVESILRGGEEGIKLLATTASCGVEREEIDALKALVAGRKLEDRIRVKKSLPFAPAILLGFLVALVFGDVFYWLAG